MNYNSFYNKPTFNHKELIGDIKASDIGGMTEEDMQELLETDLTPYYSKDEIDDLFSRSFVYREKSGPIVTFDCPSTSQSIPSLTVGIEATQSGSGDPSPTNVRPISGWSAVNVYDTGINAWDEEWEVGAYNTNDGTKANTNNQIRSKDYIEVIPNASYYWLIPYTSVISGFAVALYYDENKNYISYQNMASNGENLTVPSNCKYVTFFLSSLYGTTYNNDISINYPSTDTDYHAYNGHTYTIDLDGTRYGCTLDVVSGVLTVDRAILDLGDYSWNKGNMNTANTGRIFYFVPPSSLNMKQPSDNGKCTIFNYNPFSNWIAGQWERQILNAITITNSNAVVACVEDIYSTASDFKTAVSDQKLVYELATPLTIQLTPTAIKSLQGTNNLWADSGDIEVKCLDRIIPAGE